MFKANLGSGVALILVSMLVSLFVVNTPTFANENLETNCRGGRTERILAPAVFAHRGGKKWAPENSMAAFRESVDNAVRGIELDIHKCKSGELVVIHDDTVDRTTDGTGLVRDMTWDELKTLDCGSKYDAKFKSERLPLLKDVLDMVQGKCTINIEIKNCPMNYPGIADSLLALLADYKYPDKIIISSFDHKVLKEIAGKSSKYQLAMLGDNVPSDLSAYATATGARHWNPAFDCVRADTVEDAHKANITVNTWTLNDETSWKRAVDLGVDTIITDDPIGCLCFIQRYKAE